MDNENNNFQESLKTAETYETKQEPNQDSQAAIEYLLEDDDRPMNIFSRVISVFASPVKLMENLNKYPKMLAPIVVYIIIGIGSAIISPQVSIISLEEQSLWSVERYGTDMLNTDAILSASSGGDGTGDVINAITGISMFMGTITSPYINAFFLTVLLLILSAIFRLKPKFSQYYSMYLHTMIITSVFGLISSCLMVATNSVIDVLSVGGILFPRGNIFDPVFVALSAISVGSVWQTILVCVGLKTFTGCSTTKASVISVISLMFIVASGAVFAIGSVAFYDWMYNTLQMSF